MCMRLRYILGPLLVLTGVVYLFDFTSTFRGEGSNCAFCNQQILEKQKFFEDDLVYALYTHKPIFPGHCLILPKRHVVRFESLSNEEIERIGQVIKEVNSAVQIVYRTEPYLLLEKNGYEVGQSVPHVHFHYIPRVSGDQSLLKLLFRMAFLNLLPPISDNEMEKNVKALRFQMNGQC
jgi:histidine triad (HIT) family protein